MSHENSGTLRLAVFTLLLGYASSARAQQSGATPGSGVPPGPHPKLEIAQESIDLGEVPRIGEAQATFVIKNAGDDTLRILSAKPG